MFCTTKSIRKLRERRHQEVSGCWGLHPARGRTKLKSFSKWALIRCCNCSYLKPFHKTLSAVRKELKLVWYLYTV